MQKSFSHVPRVIYSPFNFLWQTIFFFLNKIMYSHFIFTKKILLCIWNFFSRENEIVDIFQAFIGNKTNCDGPVPHASGLEVWVFLSFYPTNNVLKFVFSRKIVAHFSVAWKNLNFIHLLLIFTVWVSIVK